MAELVCIEMVRSMDARDVCDMFRARGLIAELVQVEGRWEIAITSDEEETERAVEEVTHAVDGWLVERGFPFIPMRIGERRLTVRPPGD